jgi:hypothetical protein
LLNPNVSAGFVGEDLGVVDNSSQVAGTGDFTGTGEDSFLWRNANGDTVLWNPNGLGGFEGEDLRVVGNSWQIAGTGNFTGTGEDSILWRNANGDTELWNAQRAGPLLRRGPGRRQYELVCAQNFRSRFGGQQVSLSPSMFEAASVGEAYFPLAIE